MAKKSGRPAPTKPAATEPISSAPSAVSATSVEHSETPDTVKKVAPSSSAVEKPQIEPELVPDASKPVKESAPSPIGIHRALFALRAHLKGTNPKLTAYSDLVLSSTGYPALLASSLLAARAPQLSRHLGKLSGAISDYRTFWRMITTPATVEWGLDLLLNNTQKDCKLRLADYVQAVSGIMYQVLEDLAYLASKGVLPISAATQAHLWVVSSGFWAVHVVVELLKIAYAQAQGRPWSPLGLVTNLAWAPLTVHWSSYTGLLNPTVVGALGSLATVPRLVVAFR